MGLGVDSLLKSHLTCTCKWLFKWIYIANGYLLTYLPTYLPTYLHTYRNKTRFDGPVQFWFCWHNRPKYFHNLMTKNSLPIVIKAHQYVWVYYIDIYAPINLIFLMIRTSLQTSCKNESRHTGPLCALRKTCIIID